MAQFRPSIGAFTQQSETCVNSRLKAMHEWRQLYRGLELQLATRTGVERNQRTNSSVTYRGLESAGANRQLHRLAPTAGRLLSGNSNLPGTRRAQATICGIETSLVVPLTLGRIRRCVTIENPSLRQVAVAIAILGLFQRLNSARIYCFLRDEHNCCLPSRAYRAEPAKPQ